VVLLALTKKAYRGMRARGDESYMQSYFTSRNGAGN
jgi:hypothetical protein